MRRMPYSLLSFALIAPVLLSSCKRPHKTSQLPHEAYIWQRHWTAPLHEALTRSTPLISRWHVLSAELERTGHWSDAHPDLSALQHTHRPIIAVFRLNGRLAHWDHRAVIDHITALLTQWKQHDLSPSGIEIDYDAAADRLSDYAAFLHQLHQTLPPSHTLWITALPSWMASFHLDEALQQADHVVLQIHAVRNPHLGLFDAKISQRWLTQFATRRHGPWSVALPAYGSRVSWDERGRITSVRSEATTLTETNIHTELLANPTVIASFIHDEESTTLDGLQSWVWFRLPSAEDQRAWSLPTWHAVLSHQPLRSAITIHVTQTDPALYELSLNNDGTTDALLPPTLTVQTSCPYTMDGSNGYVLNLSPSVPRLERRTNGLLSPGHSRTIGWVRCQNDTPHMVIGTPS